MNTLGKEFTLGRFFDEDPENYTELRRRWSEAMNSEDRKDLTFAHHVLYLILIGKDWTKSVTEATNKNKLDNGYVSPVYQLRDNVGNKYFYNRLLENKVFADLISLDAVSTAFRIASFSDSSNGAYFGTEVC